jgi:amidase
MAGGEPARPFGAPAVDDVAAAAAAEAIALGEGEAEELRPVVEAIVAAAARAAALPAPPPSGGCGSAVRAGEVDLALAVDQGGSGRIPAAFCGVVAVKATHGLVPTFGVTDLGHTIDHVAPMAATVGATALLLEVIAGPDWRDPQCAPSPGAPGGYAAAEAGGVRGLRVGVVAEARDEAWCEPAVLDGLERAADALRRGGARVEPVSIPAWAHALDVIVPYIAQIAADMFRAEGEGSRTWASSTSSGWRASRAPAARSRRRWPSSSSAG